VLEAGWGEKGLSSDRGFKLGSWGVLVSLIVVLVMIALVLFFGNNITTLALLLVVSLLALLIALVVWQALKKGIGHL
jgi:hypothetical protein